MNNGVPCPTHPHRGLLRLTGSGALRTLALIAVFGLLRPPPVQAASAPQAWRAGVASVKITPEGPIWMAGYAGRTRPSEGVEQDIFAKALALDDGAGGRVVIVTTDLIGIPRSMRDFVEQQCRESYGLKPEELLLNASHTHCGPEVRTERMPVERTASRAGPEIAETVQRYREWLDRRLVSLVGEALERLEPAQLEFSYGRAGFAMNRRRPGDNGGFSNNPYPAGPVDHEVPVLKVSDAGGEMKALLFGYACHNTTLNFYRISGDYAGYAQEYLETSYPGTTALFLTGCAGDQNPYPRRAMVPDQPPEELVKQHGRALANAVSTALGARLRPVAGPLRPALDYARLEYWPLPRRELESRLSDDYSAVVQERARTLLQMQERGEPLPTFDCPVQVLRFGDDLTLVAIGGEVVVDYSLRLKRELEGPAYVWVAGYSNDVFGYLASRRVLEEGGYEGGGANFRVLNHPGPFTYDTENRIIGMVLDLWRRTSRPQGR